MSEHFLNGDKIELACTQIKGVAELTDFNALWITIYAEVHNSNLKEQIAVGKSLANRCNKERGRLHILVREEREYHSWFNRKVLAETFWKAPVLALKQAYHVALGVEVNAFLVDPSNGASHYMDADYPAQDYKNKEDFIYATQIGSKTFYEYIG